MSVRRLRLVLLALVALAGALYGSAYLLTGSSGFARAVVWGESDIEDRHRFPARAIQAGGDDWPLPQAPARLRLDEFLEERSTRAFLVLHRGRLVYERYFNGGSRKELETSFSVAKSFLSTLIGIAIEEGAISGLDEPITRRLPELEERDRRFARIRVRDLLSMSSGIRYEEGGMPWSDDAVTYYGTDLREVALEDTEIEQPPGMGWHYNNFNPLLLGLILERATGKAVAEYMETRLWRPMRAEADASWSLDSEDSGFEKMESGVNARARDFARFGLLMLRGGRAGSGRVVAPGWVRAATVDHSGYFGYGLGWWVEAGSRGGQRPFLARGKYGQVVVVDPAHDAVVVRLGSDDAGVDWKTMALDVATRVNR
jgi:CubicO group peptidase (beta-lactamase class C family)